MYNNPYTLVKHAASIFTFLDQTEPLSGAMELQFRYMCFSYVICGKCMYVLK